MLIRPPVEATGKLGAETHQNESNTWFSLHNIQGSTVIEGDSSPGWSFLLLKISNSCHIGLPNFISSQHDFTREMQQRNLEEDGIRSQELKELYLGQSPRIYHSVALNTCFLLM